MNSIEIKPRTNLDSEVSIPGSKSCTARALVMAALTQGQSTLTECADCDDTDFLVAGLQEFGVTLKRKGNTIVCGGGPLSPPSRPVFLGNSGTAVRFLTAACATLNGMAVIDGNQRMRERPVRDLIEAMSAWGIEILSETGTPPLTIISRGDFGGETCVKGSASSQYLSGLLMVAPKAARKVTVHIEGDLVSKPYVDLTIAMMRERGVEVSNENYTRFDVANGKEYKPDIYPIEADASGASYFFAAAAVAGGRVRVNNLSPKSHQGDVGFPRVLEKMGCKINVGDNWIEVVGDGNLKGIDIDLNAMPDMAQTLAVTALFADGPTRIRNVHNLRIKETDRIAATAAELRKLGATVTEHDDGLEIVPGEPRPAAIDTYDDHRMAMSFSLAGLRIPGVVINDPACVSKTFPDFFARFEGLK